MYMPSATVLVAAVCALALSACAWGAPREAPVPSAATVGPAALPSHPDITVAENLGYGEAAGAPLLLDVCLPNDAGVSRAAIVSIHGGSWARGDKGDPHWREVCQWLASEGFVALSVNYRLAPSATFPAQIEDVRQVVSWLRQPAQVLEYDIDPARIGVFGGSAGGNLAALLGVEGEGDLDEGSRVAAVAELSGPTDLTGVATTPDFAPVQLAYLGCPVFDGCAAAVAASPIHHVDASDPPFFVAHSVGERIPLAQSETFVDALREAGVDVEFVTVEGTLHSIAMLDDALRERIAAFFRRELPEPAVTVVAEDSGAATTQ